VVDLFNKLGGTAVRVHRPNAISVRAFFYSSTNKKEKIMIEGERLILRLPTKEDENLILEMVQEFKENGENIIPGSGNFENFENKMLDKPIKYLYNMVC
jgi:hypothetical protein